MEIEKQQEERNTKEIFELRLEVARLNDLLARKEVEKQMILKKQKEGFIKVEVWPLYYDFMFLKAAGEKYARIYYQAERMVRVEGIQFYDEQQETKTEIKRPADSNDIY